MAQDWIDASDELADNEKVLIGEVDCTQQRDLCGKQSVQGYPTLKAFKKGVFSDEVYTRQKNAVVDYVNSQLGGGDAADAPAAAKKRHQIRRHPRRLRIRSRQSLENRWQQFR